MSDARYDCLCTGIIVADSVCDPVDHLPPPGGLVLTPGIRLAVGGCASNVASDLARLDRKVGVVGPVGRDVYGGYVREVLEASGVDCAHLAESPSQPTSGTLVLNVRGEDRRFIHCIGANGDFTGREVTPGLIRSSRVLYLGGYLLAESLTAENVQAMFREAREAGVTTVLDVVVPGAVDYSERLHPVLEWTDVFIPNEDEGRLLTGLDDPMAQALYFRDAGARTVIVTCGADGAVLAGERVKLRAGGYAAEVVDGTGSGDAFSAGYIYGLLTGGDTADCLRYGSALGASAVRSAGATTGVFTAEELETFVESQELPLSEV